MRTGRLFTAILSTLAFCLVLATAADAKRVEIIISKIGQKMTVKVDGDTEYVWPVSTGVQKYETPVGDFKPFRMEAEHYSKEWDDAPMPHSIFFTGNGHAIHGSPHIKSLGRKASHGCVRLHPDNAAKLFSIVSDAGLSNTRVVVKGGLFSFNPAKTATSTPRRSWWEVNDSIKKTTTKKAEVKTEAKKAKPKKVALKCTVKDGKKTCKKPFALFGGTNG